MLKQTFQQMARAIEAKPVEAVENSRAHILVHALEVAHDHEAALVRDFAGGSDAGAYAEAVLPMLRLFAPVEDINRVRDALSDIFNLNLDAAWEGWTGGQTFEDRAGVETFLKCEGRVRAPYRQQALGWE